jgi:regulator of sigma E protease|tara:strand:- start:1467 stop:2795 length:1329 start_codon:yes stop_codon:yes gene_type:complete
MTETLIKAAQFFLSLSFLIVLHELGHFIPARFFKIRVEKFYLFFDPYFSIFKKKIGDTEYGIGWLPLGGYVKISGMIDESMDTDQLSAEPQPWEFRSKPAWQRLIVMMGGVTVNLVLAMGIYAMILFTWGGDVLKTENAVYGIECSELAKEIGFQNGDKILTVDGVYYESFIEIPEAILISGASEVIVERKGQEVSIPIPTNIVEQFIEKKGTSGFIGLAWPYIAQQFEKGSVAEAAGVQAGDQLIGINGEEMLYFSEYINKLPTLAGQEINLSVLRGMDTLNYAIALSEPARLGVYYVPPTELIIYDHKEYGFFESFPAGTALALDKLDSYVQQFKLILNPETGAWKGLGGFITMGKQFKSEWDWKHFWNFTAFLSIILAFMNILPIPALDGGHVMFLLWEIVTGKSPSDKFLEYAQMFGFFILMGLLLLANGNDIINLFN